MQHENHPQGKSTPSIQGIRPLPRLRTADRKGMPQATKTRTENQRVQHVCKPTLLIQKVLHDRMRITTNPP